MSYYLPLFLVMCSPCPFSSGSLGWWLQSGVLVAGNGLASCHCFESFNGRKMIILLSSSFYRLHAFLISLLTCFYTLLSFHLQLHVTFDFFSIFMKPFFVTPETISVQLQLCIYLTGRWWICSLGVISAKPGPHLFILCLYSTVSCVSTSHNFCYHSRSVFLCTVSLCSL